MTSENPGSRVKLRSLLFANRRTLRELEAEGVSRQELKAAVRAVNDAGELPKGESHDFLAAIIAAELVDNKDVQLPGAINWDKIIELIEKLMPLIETWLAMCMVV